LLTPRGSGAPKLVCARWRLDRETPPPLLCMITGGDRIAEPGSGLEPESLVLALSLVPQPAEEATTTQTAITRTALTRALKRSTISPDIARSKMSEARRSRDKSRGPNLSSTRVRPSLARDE
jgi:hypothetical protein